MLWCDFRYKLKKLNPLFWINENASRHDTHPELETLGVYFDKHHIAGVTYDDVPMMDIYDDQGVMTHQGLRSILKNVLNGKEKYAETLSEFWKMGKGFDLITYPVSAERIRKIFGVTESEIRNYKL